ncbi:MAG: hypothetical protein TREMPRED_004819 [Tremellales sp. Tagirdzhanova-0007]|nr:MAG: hypothetical protein TREMPRED_004819 [Tremellales sp. Tagirdzhanova-0007]
MSKVPLASPNDDRSPKAPGDPDTFEPRPSAQPPGLPARQRRRSFPPSLPRTGPLPIHHDNEADAGRRARLLGFQWFAKGMRNDVRARAPWYGSDWVDAWNYRVIPSTWFIFFANILPGIAFSLDLIEVTGQYGVQEILLSTFMAAFVASILGGQPLLISGVTGPITVFSRTIYNIIESRGADRPNYLHFMGWVYLWGAIFHWIAASLNAVRGLKYVTRFSCDTFGFYVAAVYVQLGIQTVIRQFQQSSATAAFLGIILALVTLVTPHYFIAIANSGYVGPQFRRFCSDYGMPITIIAATGLAYWGRFDMYVLESSMTLPTTGASFRPANGRAWLVPFWQLEGNPLSLKALNFRSANRQLSIGISFYWASLPSSPVYSAFLHPMACLIPQAPLHTASLVMLGYDKPSSASSETTASFALGDPRLVANDNEHAVRLSDMENGHASGRSKSPSGGGLRRRLSVKMQQKETVDVAGKEEVPVAVVEQRVSNLAQGCLCLVLMTKPLEHVLGLIPKGVLAGLFWYMGTNALMSSGVTEKLLYLIRERRTTSPTHPLDKVRKSRIALFTIVELLGFGATFAVTQTIAAIGFPIIITMLVPIRVFVVPRLGFSDEELDILDGPVASPFTMESVGGSL